MFKTTAKIFPRYHEGFAKRRPKSPRWHQRCVKEAFGQRTSCQPAFDVSPGVVLGIVLIHFWKDFEDFGIILERFWVHGLQTGCRSEIGAKTESGNVMQIITKMDGKCIQNDRRNLPKGFAKSRPKSTGSCQRCVKEAFGQRTSCQPAFDVSPRVVLGIL